MVTIPLALYACADDDETPPGPKNLPAAEAGPVADTSVADTSSNPDTGFLTVSKCTQADFDAPASDNGGDFTAQALTVTFPTDPAPAQYKRRCAKVKAGASVTFTGAFSNHPLEPNGGTMPTPIPQLTSMDPDGGSISITFPNKGTYGYECQFHPQQMYGAVLVVP